jgi:hypothetical protein
MGVRGPTVGAGTADSGRRPKAPGSQNARCSFHGSAGVSGIERQTRASEDVGASGLAHTSRVAPHEIQSSAGAPFGCRVPRTSAPGAVAPGRESWIRPPPRDCRASLKGLPSVVLADRPWLPRMDHAPTECLHPLQRLGEVAHREVGQGGRNRPGRARGHGRRPRGLPSAFASPLPRHLGERLAQRRGVAPRSSGRARHRRRGNSMSDRGEPGTA